MSPPNDTGRPAPSPRDQLAVYRPEVARLLADADMPAYRYAQVYEHLMRRPGLALSAATNLPLALREELDALGTYTLTEAGRREDADGTTKLLLAARDGAQLETVAMRYERRTTLCVSTQVGCSLECSFCATGAMGFVRDLAPAEIVDQVRLLSALLATEDREVTNIVFMGMGEPLLNLDAVLAAIRLLKDPAGLAFAQRALSVSTIGIPAGIRRLAREEPQVNLALSLHAPDDALRTRLIPANRRFPLAEVLTAADDHFSATHRKLFVEYVLLGGVNDSPRQATALAALLRGRVVTVNLIPWNPGCGDYSPPSEGTAIAFRDILEQRGVTATLRLGRGRAIAAGCGQLATRSARRTPGPGWARGSR
ncbi:MAG: 23S rRNA (adenine(2503)-C(2))-methyltransferase RlmN [Thermoleophilia bacterium]